MINQLTPERIKELRAIIAAARISPTDTSAMAGLYAYSVNELTQTLDAIEAKDARIAELEAALKPFADEASEYDQGQFEDRDSPYFNTFNIGQLRTARAALNHKEPAA